MSSVATASGLRANPETMVRFALIACLVVHLSLSLLWATLIPPFEAHDETGHFAHAQYVAAHLRIPPPGGVLTPWFDEAHQPPLYYWAAGVPATLFGLGGDYKPEMNPFFLRGDGQGGVNAVVHVPSSEGWLQHRWTALLWWCRAVSAVFGTVAVLITFAVTKRLIPKRPWIAVLAAAIAAGTPTFVFLSGAANNDAAIAAMGGAAVLACLWWLEAEPVAISSVHSAQSGRTKALAAAIVAGVAIGLALLTKNSALPLIAGLGLTPLVRWRNGRVGLWTASVEATAGSIACFLTAAWWYLRNLFQYGHFVMDRSVSDSITLQPLPPTGALAQAASSHFASSLIQYSFSSYWTLFGWGNIAPPATIKVAFAVLSVLALCGLFLLLARKAVRKALLPNVEPVLVAFMLFTLLTALPLYRAVRFAAPTLLPGRYLFVSLAVSSALLALGVWAATDLIHRNAAVGARLVAGVFPPVLAIGALFGTVLPRYAPPQFITESDAARSSTPQFVDYGHTIALLGYRIADSRVEPGGNLQVTLYWKALALTSKSYSVTVQIVDDGRKVVGRTDRLPGVGAFPTTLWRPGNVFAERYLVQLDPLTPKTPQLGHVVVNIVEFTASTPGGKDFIERSSLPAMDSDGHPIPQVVFGDLRLGAYPSLQSMLASRYQLDGRFDLDRLDIQSQGAKVGGVLPVALTIQCLQPTDRKATLFVHVLDSNGRLVAQQDAEPHVAGRLYPTTLWIKGETIQLESSVVLPTDLAVGAYRAEVGMYWRDDQKRLSIRDAAGKPVPDDRLLTDTFDIAN